MLLGAVVFGCSSSPPDPASTPSRTPTVHLGEDDVRPVTEPPPRVRGDAVPALERPEPRRSFVSVPRLGLVDVPVVRYRGTPDDGPGTAIQDRGLMASPRGSGGLVGPGEVGNFLVTGHRTSLGAPLGDLPLLGRGDVVRVRSGATVFRYRVTTTRQTSFRSPRSLRQQSAAVPGRPRASPTRPFLTLSTCRTPEDHAEGNYWSDEFKNPEHRIDKVAVLVSTRPARS
ncbi:hypothetical protein GCM10028771_12020 [Nocardioides marmoraquaticus]